ERRLLRGVWHAQSGDRTRLRHSCDWFGWNGGSTANDLRTEYWIQRWIQRPSNACRKLKKGPDRTRDQGDLVRNEPGVICSRKGGLYGAVCSSKTQQRRAAGPLLDRGRLRVCPQESGPHDRNVRRAGG